MLGGLSLGVDFGVSKELRPTPLSVSLSAPVFGSGCEISQLLLQNHACLPAYLVSGLTTSWTNSLKV